MYKNQSDIRKKILDELFDINSDFLVDVADGRGAASNKNKTARINIRQINNIYKAKQICFRGNEWIFNTILYTWLSSKMYYLIWCKRIKYRFDGLPIKNV